MTDDCRCTLTILPDGKYTFTEHDSLRGKSKAGSLTVHAEPYPWVDFASGLRHGDARDHRLFRFQGSDTLVLRDADFGTVAIDGGADHFVRAGDESKAR
jgi:hypothetical protein